MFYEENKILTGDKSYAYESGQVRGLEPSLLKKGHYRKLLEIELKEATQFLAEFGYDLEDIQIFDNILSTYTNTTLSLAEELIKNESFVKIFSLEDDLSNLALCIKNTIVGNRECEHYSPGGMINPLDFKRALEANDLSRIPAPFNEIAEQILLDYEEYQEPALIDDTVELAFLKYVQNNLPINHLVEEYWKKRSDFANLETFLRIKISDRENKYFWKYFIENGYLNKR